MAELWYFTCEGKQMEPVTAAELKQLATTGFLRATDMVWKEGMANWVKASAIKGLIPAGATTSSASSPAIKGRGGDTVMSPGRPKSREEPVVEDRPRRRPRETDDLEEIEDDRPKRRRKQPAKGMSGLVIGLIAGGVILGLAVIVTIIVLAVRGGSTNNPLGKDMIADYTFNIGPSQMNDRDFSFNAGTMYEFRVTSDKNTDVDLRVQRGENEMFALDESIGPNSFLIWGPAESGNYRVRIVNLDPVRGNRSHVVIKKLPAAGQPGGVQAVGGKKIGNPNPAPQPPMPKFPMGNFPGQMPTQGRVLPVNTPINGPTRTAQVQVGPGQSSDTFVTFTQAKLIDVSVTADIAGDVDLLVDQNGRYIVSDVNLSPNSRVSFMAQPNVPYRFRVSNLSAMNANCTITYTEP